MKRRQMFLVFLSHPKKGPSSEWRLVQCDRVVRVVCAWGAREIERRVARGISLQFSEQRERDPSFSHFGCCSRTLCLLSLPSAVPASDGPDELVATTSTGYGALTAPRRPCTSPREDLTACIIHGGVFPRYCQLAANGRQGTGPCSARPFRVAGGARANMEVLNINVGILGHVDSGKTSLVKALSTVLSTASLDKNPQV